MKSCYRGIARIKDNIACKIQDLLKILRRHVQDKSHSGRNALEVPDMRDGSRQDDASHALSSHRALGDLNAAAVADHTLVPDLLILSAVAFPVLARPENALAEESVCLRLKRSVVDGLRLLDFAEHLISGSPLTNLVRGSQSDPDRVKCHRLINFIRRIIRHEWSPFTDYRHQNSRSCR